MITAKDVLRIFGGGYLVRLDLGCPQCKERGRAIKVVWPERERWQCHFCGREATPPHSPEKTQRENNNLREVIK